LSTFISPTPSHHSKVIRRRRKVLAQKPGVAVIGIQCGVNNPKTKKDFKDAIENFNGKLVELTELNITNNQENLIKIRKAICESVGDHSFTTVQE